jgi:hypothetical protein
VECQCKIRTIYIVGTERNVKIDIMHKSIYNSGSVYFDTAVKQKLKEKYFIFKRIFMNIVN